MSTSSIPQDFDALFDLTANSFVDGLDAASLAMFDTQQLDKVQAFVSGTVSPKDLHVDTAPPSTTFTDLSTPSFESSGYFSHDTSPLFADADLGSGHEQWESLFPTDPTPLPEVKPSAPVPSPVPAPAVAPQASPVVASSPPPGASPRSGRNGRHSSVSGVKPRSRDKPLPPIVYDSNDPVAVKRARNTEAARKSRARKVELQESMERRIAELEKQLEEARQSEQYWRSIAQAKA